MLEQEKWDEYYASLPIVQEDCGLSLLNEELVSRILDLVPSGSRILEAGCGAGWHSLALARTGAFHVSLMDFSEQALEYARRIFAREGLKAEFLFGDVRSPGDRQYDLVFNAGVLEHYTFDQQVAFLRGMASRSHRYVLTLVPNADCYWYWLWRLSKTVQGNWPFGQEMPAVNLSAAYVAAGLAAIGRTYMGETWIEGFIRDLPGMSEDLCSQILRLHQSPLIPKAQKSYLLATLGCVSEGPVSLPACWAESAAEGSGSTEMLAALADALALAVHAETDAHRSQKDLIEKEQNLQVIAKRLEEEERKSETLAAQVKRLAGEVDAIHSSKWWRAVGYYWSARSRVKAIGRSVLPLRMRRWLRRRQRTRAGLAALLSADQASLPPAERLDILCFPVIDWDFRYQRPQQLLTHFAYAGHRVFYLSTKFMGFTQAVPPVRSVAERVYELALPGDPDTIIYEDNLEGRTLDEALAAFKDFARREAIVEAVCIVHHPFWEPLVAALRECYGWKIVYDCMDDHSGFQTNSSAALSHESKLVQRGDLVVATSRHLYEKVSKSQAHCLLIPNAGDYAHFSNLPDRSASPLAHLPRPVIGYYGAIAEWFDTEAVRLAALRHPEWSFVLIGHTFGADLRNLERLPNVLLPGEVPYQELPAYLAGIDVCTIPFLNTPLTEATNPVKVFEYLSAGKPVVATALPELASLAEVVYQYTTTDQFIALLEQALAEDSTERAAMRRVIARQNTWDMRYRAFDEGIRSLYGKASIIVVTWNGLNHTRRCIDSILEDQTWPNMEVVVVDNASKDGTVEYLEELAQRDRRVRLILNDENRGFAAANNLGLQQTQDSEFVVLLNNDTVVPRGWLCRLLRHARRPEVGIVGPVTNWTGNEAKIDVAYQDLRDMPAFARAYTQAHEGKTFDIRVLAMYCVAMRRDIVDQIGPLDERFGLGMFEDDDYARRVRQAGYRVICAQDVFVHHEGMASFAKLGEAEYRSLFERNKKLYEEKWGEPWVPHKDQN